MIDWSALSNMLFVPLLVAVVTAAVAHFLVKDRETRKWLFEARLKIYTNFCVKYKYMVASWDVSQFDRDDFLKDVEELKIVSSKELSGKVNAWAGEVCLYIDNRKMKQEMAQFGNVKGENTWDTAKEIWERKKEIESIIRKELHID